MTTPAPGTIGWLDLTTADATRIRDFYASIVGWTHDAVPMGSYDDYVMKAANGESVSGICHARGINAGLPSTWLIYITVADLAASLKKVEVGGGKILRPAFSMGAMGSCAVIQDPSGASVALFEHAKA